MQQQTLEKVLFAALKNDKVKIMNNKKAQGMPLNTIVIAAIVLVVMVVLILIFTRGMAGHQHRVRGYRNIGQSKGRMPW